MNQTPIHALPLPKGYKFIRKNSLADDLLYRQLYTINTPTQSNVQVEEDTFINLVKSGWESARITEAFEQFLIDNEIPRARNRTKKNSKNRSKYRPGYTVSFTSLASQRRNLTDRDRFLVIAVDNTLITREDLTALITTKLKNFPGVYIDGYEDHSGKHHVTLRSHVGWFIYRTTPESVVA